VPLYEVGSALSFLLPLKNLCRRVFGSLGRRFSEKRRLKVKSEDESVAATADDIVESTKRFHSERAEQKN
jgi:hypothetical protein